MTGTLNDPTLRSVWSELDNSLVADDDTVAEIITKLIALGEECDLSAEELGTKWDAYRFTHKQSILSNKNWSGYSDYVREGTKKQRSKKASRHSTSLSSVLHTTTRPMTINASTLSSLLGDDEDDIPMVKSEPVDEMEEERVITSSPTSSPPPSSVTKRKPDESSPSASTTRIDFTPQRPRLPTNNTTDHLSWSPHGFQSPTTSRSSLAAALPGSSVKYEQRTNRGDIVLTFNGEKLAAAQPKSGDEEGPSASIIDLDDLSHNDTTFRYMHDDDDTRRDVLNMRMETLYESMSNTKEFNEMSAVVVEPVVKQEETSSSDAAVKTAENDEEEPKSLELVTVTTRGQEKALFRGRICIDDSDNASGTTKLSASTCMLEGDMGMSSGKRVHLQLTSTPEYALFPGQVVTVKGVNTNGNSIVVEQIITNASLPHRSLPLSTIRAYNPPSRQGHPLSIMVASGPYTTADDLKYTPLLDLVKQAAAFQPDALILIGPFIDSDSTILSHPNNIQRTYDEMFIELINDILQRLNGKTRLIVVPSGRDLHHDCVFPQPPFDLNTTFHQDVTSGRLTCLSNPTTFTINDIVIGITSHDVVHYLAAEPEIYKKSSDTPSLPRLHRLASHLITQQSYFPLFPIPLGASVDLNQYERMNMIVTPDILITPSQLNAWAGDIGGGVLSVNPAFLTKSSGAGSYALISCHPLTEEEMVGSDRSRVSDHRIMSRTRVDIVRI